MRAWMLVALVAGCDAQAQDGETQNGDAQEVGSAQAVTVMEEVLACEEGPHTLTIPGINATTYTIEGCSADPEYCYPYPTGTDGFGFRIFPDDTVEASCNGNGTLRIRYLVIE